VFTLFFSLSMLQQFNNDSVTGYVSVIYATEQSSSVAQSGVPESGVPESGVPESGVPDRNC